MNITYRKVMSKGQMNRLDSSSYFFGKLKIGINVAQPYAKTGVIG